MTHGGYSAVARKLSEVLRPEVPVSRQQVYEWSKRGTRNAAGTPFPQPGDDGRFSFLDVIEWYSTGLAPRSTAQRLVWDRYREAA